jgi:tRNA pseudouridine38-40 synthase
VSVDVDGGPPAGRAAEALNTALPDDVSVLVAEEATPDFHARHSALSRSYRYRIWRRRTPSPFEEKRSWWYPRPVDEERMQDAANLLLGEHDFRAFTPTATSSVRNGTVAATCSSSRSPPTAFCVTWCARSSAR